MKKITAVYIFFALILIGCKKDEPIIKEPKKVNITLRTNASFLILNGSPVILPSFFDTTLNEGKHRFNFILTTNQILRVQIWNDNGMVIDTFGFKPLTDYFIDL
jgi:hypothetical protein